LRMEIPSAQYSIICAAAYMDLYCVLIIYKRSKDPLQNINQQVNKFVLILKKPADGLWLNKIAILLSEVIF